MAELTLTTLLTLDGVMQAPGGANEDTTGDSSYGGWVFSHWDEKTGRTIDDIFSKAEAFLLGRTTYDIFAAYWPHNTDKYELVANQLFNAPRSLVFNVWTQPEHFSRWLGPKNFTTIGCQMNVQVGGMYRACIRSPEGTDHWMQGVYREVIEPERLVFTFAWEDENSQPKHETLVTVIFTEQNNQTLMTFHQAIFESTRSCNSHRSGWNECFDRLNAYLANTMSGKT